LVVIMCRNLIERCWGVVGLASVS